MNTNETLRLMPESSTEHLHQGYTHLFIERFSSGKPYLFSDVFGSDPLSSEEYNSTYVEMIRFMRHENEDSPEGVAIRNVFFANLVQFFQIYGHKKFINDTHEFIEDLSYETAMYILRAIKKGGTFDIERGNFLSYATTAVHHTRINLKQREIKNWRMIPASQLDMEGQNYMSTVADTEEKEDPQAEILTCKVRRAIKNVLESLSREEIEKKWGDIFERFYLKGQSQEKIYEELGVSRSCFVSCTHSMRKRLKIAIVERCDEAERKTLAKKYLSKVIGGLPDTQKEMILSYLGLDREKKTREEIAELFDFPVSTSNKKLKEGLEFIREEFLKMGLWAELTEVIMEKNKDNMDLLNWFVISTSDRQIYINPGLSNALKQAMKSQKPRDQFILRNHLGLDGVPRSTRDIGLACGISQKRVMQIIERDIKKIEEQLKNGEYSEMAKLHFHTVVARKLHFAKKKKWIVSTKDGEEKEEKYKGVIPEELMTVMRDNLSDPQRKVLEAILRSPDLTYAEIGEELGVTQSSISRILSKILEKLKKHDCLLVEKTRGKIAIKILGEVVSRSQKDQEEIEILLADIQDPKEKIKAIVERFADEKRKELLLARLGLGQESRTQKELALWFNMDQRNLCVVLKREFGKLRAYMQMAGIANEFDSLLSEVNRINKTKKESKEINVLPEEILLAASA